MRVLIYIPDKAERTLALLTALKDGFKAYGDETQVAKTTEFKEIDPWAQMVVCIDLHTQPIANAYRRAGRHLLLVERGYFYPEKYFRFALDGYQPKMLHLEPMTLHRAEAILEQGNIILASPRKHKLVPENILYVGNSFLYRQWHRLREAFDVNITRHISSKLDPQHTVIWFKPDHYPAPAAYPPNCEMLQEKDDVLKVLNECDLVVEHGGFWGVTALIAGLPVAITSENSPVTTIAPQFPLGIYNPFEYTHKERMQVLANLAHYQFNLEEIASGMAMQHMTPHTFKRVELSYKGNPNDKQYIIDQYKLMHEMGKYRGGFNETLMTHMKALFKRYKPETLLDYGSGKGHQYDYKAQHLEWHGEVKPACYDPGFEPFAKKPEGTFEGVICTDVAEHIPEPEVDAFLREVINYATKCVFLCIYTKEAVKSLPDGRNAHLTTQHAKWWAKRIVAIMEERFGQVDIRNNDNHTWTVSTLDESFAVLAAFRGDEGAE